MKKLLSLMLTIALLTPSITLSAQVQPARMFQNATRIYEMWPRMLAGEIDEHVAMAEKYIFLSPTAKEAELSALKQAMVENERRLNNLLKSKITDDNFIYDLYQEFANAERKQISKSPFSLKYTKEVINSINSGGTSKTAVTVLKDTPEFFGKSALKMLDSSALDFNKLVSKIEKTFAVKRSRAVSLALAVEVERAQTLLGTKIQGLRQDIAYRKMLIRQAGDRATKDVAVWRKQMAEAQRQILELKRISPDTYRTLGYAVGEKEFDNIVQVVTRTNVPEFTMASGRRMSTEGLTKIRNSAKGLRSFLPVALGVGLFLTVFATQADAANTAQSEVAGAVANRVNLKREILTAVNTNPENIGIIYTGGQEVKNMVGELFVDESDNSLSAEKLLPYIEEWAQRIKTLTSDNTAMEEYLSTIKAVNDASIKQQLSNRIHDDLVIQQDNTRVNKIVPVDLVKFERN